MTRVALALACGAVVSVASIDTAHADQYKYLGGHPHGNGYCHIEAPHVHAYRPAKTKARIQLLYRVHNGYYHFVGDPVAYGYDGPRHSYYGHHPIAVDVVAHTHVAGAPHDIEYCYIDGPHFHWYAPPSDLSFEVKGDAYWYIGPYPEEYNRRKKLLVRINGVYRPMKYRRPVIEVEPPVGYIGPVVEVHAPGVHVEGPGVHVHGPAIEAGLEVSVGLPGVIVTGDHHHHHYERRHKHSGKSWRKYTKKRRHKRKHH